MPYSYTQLPGDGSNTNFTFAFGYLSKLHISATINGTSTAFSWLTDFSIQINPAPAAGTIIEIRRKTPLNEPIVDWSDGSVITEHDMDLNTLFSLYLAQEAQDSVEATVSLNALGKWDGKGREAINFANPTSDASLITKGFFDSVYAPALDAKVTAAANSATASANSAGQSAASATSASSSASDAAATLALFRGQYLGAQASNPTVDGNGNPVTAGDLYFNTTANEVRVYSGSTWKAAGSVIDGVIGRPPGNVPVIATAGQTSVPVNGGYNAGFILVTVNGSLMSAPAVNATSGTHLVFSTPLAAGDKIDWYAFGMFQVADTFTKSALMGAGGAGNIGNAPSGGIVATTVQAAIDELNTKKAFLAGSSAYSFAVAEATLATHAIPLAQADARYATSAHKAVPIRQTVSSGSVDANGMANFLTASSGLAVSIIATPTPLTLCFAAGFNANGAVDYVERIPATVISAWSGFAASATLFLYAERSAGTGEISYGATTLAPVYSTIAPTSPASVQHWFDTSAYVMKVWTGSAWTTVQRLFIGECVTGPSSVISVTTYAINGRYRSAVYTGLPSGVGVVTSFTHNLGIPQNNMLTIPQLFAVCTTSDAGFAVGDIVTPLATTTGALVGYQPVFLTGRNTLALQAGGFGTGWCTSPKGGGGAANMVIANWNFYITANRGW